MKRLALITLHTPTETNFRAASALPFHLAAFRNSDIELEIWSFNVNQCDKERIKKTEQELNAKIHIIPVPKWYEWLKPAPVRLFLPKPIFQYLPLSHSFLNEIKRYLGNRDTSGLWIYGEELSNIARNFKDIPIVVTTPDCEAMYYHRVLSMKGIPLSKKALLRYNLMYHRYAKMTSKFPTGESIHYHLVGKEDAKFLKNLNPAANAVFINHPHYSLSTLSPSPIEKGEKIRLLIAGEYNFPMAQAADEAFEAMATLPQPVKDGYLVTFLGKDWDKSVELLRKWGFEVEQKGYVEDYAAEVASHHIQLTPVCVGTGTKGKVLDAFANGLMVIGTPLALENIQAERGSECIEYSSGEKLTEALTQLSRDPDRISQIAKAGKEAILKNHSRSKVAEQFFRLFQ